MTLNRLRVPGAGSYLAVSMHAHKLSLCNNVTSTKKVFCDMRAEIKVYEKDSQGQIMMDS